MAVARGLHERVFAWMTLGDERNLAAACVAGVPRYRRTTSAPCRTARPIGSWNGTGATTEPPASH